MKYLRTLILIGLLSPSFVHAGMIVDTYRFADGSVEVSVYIEATTTAINAVEGTLLLDAAQTWNTIETGGSVVLYWLTAPKIEGKTVSFSGIIPGGFVGVAAATGLTGDGLLFTLRGTESEATPTLTNTALYLSDGEGTKIAPVPVDYVETTSEGGLQKEEDRTPPEWVTGERIEEGGVLLLVLSAVDKESGVAYFEVKEGDGSWVQTQNPYVLSQESAKKSIYIRAYDQAGNFREIQLSAASDMRLVIGSVFIALLILLLYFGIRRWKQKNRI